jgi:hypothetical protein
MRLHLAAWDDDGDGVLRDIEINLCEDFRSVMVWAVHKDGRFLGACFELPSPVTEEEFDRNYWLSIFDAQGAKNSCCCCR